MVEPADDLQTALDAVHEDKKAVLKSQRADIEKEIVERRLIAADTTLQVEDEVREVNSSILNLTPESPEYPDAHRRERHLLEREKRELTHEEREEQRETWKDVQQLKREEREIDREALQGEQRRKRVQDLL
jgi:hypothetical protein